MRVLVPADALAALCTAAGEEPTIAFGRSLGDAAGRRIANRLDGGVETPSSTRAANGGEAPARVPRAASGCSIEAVLEQLSGEMALAGLGITSMERWGRALVLLVDGSPLGAAGDRLLRAVLEGAVSAMTGSHVSAIVLGRAGERVRVLVTGPEGAGKARTWLNDGASWVEVLARLHSDTHGSGNA
jgi:hypothetical protein